ncbi:unknown [Clostridium sp. CAG:269]|nr:unknown [Clostridium sp. CAG:269]
MENIEYSNSLYQINEILKYMEPNLKARIPKKFISYFENNKSQEYSWTIDKSQPLEKQDLLPTTKEILTVLYKEFICDDIEKIELEKTLSNNEIKYQEKLREKYNPDNIFEDRKSNPKTEQIENENTSIAYKESFFSKLINKIKLIFSK